MLLGRLLRRYDWKDLRSANKTNLTLYRFNTPKFKSYPGPVRIFKQIRLCHVYEVVLVHQLCYQR